MKKTHCSGNDKKPSMLETGTEKINLAESSRGCLRFQKTSSWGRNSSLLWLEGHMTNKILIPLQSLVSCFLKPPVSRRVAVGTTEGSGSGYLVAVAQGG